MGHLQEGLDESLRESFSFQALESSQTKLTPGYQQLLQDPVCSTFRGFLGLCLKSFGSYENHQMQNYSARLINTQAQKLETKLIFIYGNMDSEGKVNPCSPYLPSMEHDLSSFY